MRKKYQVIALDMDGTVLNDKKEVGQRTRAAIHKALAAGREVVFCTGRSYAEMGGILQEFPDMHYLCGESGALLYDLKKNVPLKLLSIPEREISRIRETIAGRDIMPHFISEGRSIVNCAQLRRMEYYQMGAYQSAYLRTAMEVEDESFVLRPSKEREKTRKDLEQQQLFLTMVDSEISSLECTSQGVSKATGLNALCSELGISLEQVIMVGDADNDCEALRAAGLSVAMGNANRRVKTLCDVQVADNNHDGCAQAIEKYLFGETI